MGNIKAWGGPLSKAWNDRTLKLQKKILQRMREFGMMPILPAFAGHVPDAISRYLDRYLQKVTLVSKICPTKGMVPQALKYEIISNYQSFS